MLRREASSGRPSRRSTGAQAATREEEGQAGMDYLEEPAGTGHDGAGMSEAPTPPGTRETYSWAGTDRHGVAHTGRTGLPLADIARITENYYRQGWRSLRVWDMAAAPVELVAAIEPSPDTGRRAWWSEVPEHQAEAGSCGAQDTC